MTEGMETGRDGKMGQDGTNKGYIWKSEGPSSSLALAGPSDVGRRMGAWGEQRP